MWVTIPLWLDDSGVRPILVHMQAPSKLMDLGKHFNGIRCPSSKDNYKTHDQVRLDSNEHFNNETMRSPNSPMSFWCKNEDVVLCEKLLDNWSSSVCNDNVTKSSQKKSSLLCNRSGKVKEDSGKQ